jgi:hypothetical protein
MSRRLLLVALLAVGGGACRGKVGNGIDPGDGSTPPGDPSSGDTGHGDNSGGDSVPADYGPPGDPGPFVPHPTLVGLADNTSINLGALTCTPPEGEDGYCERVTDYSGLVYDGRNHQLLMFGGGHSTTMTDAVFAFDLATSLAWRELYLPTPCDRMVAGNLDDALGAWLAGTSGPYPRPLSAHTYDLLGFAPVQNDFVLLGRMFTGGYCNTVGNDIGGPIAHYSLTAGTWTFSSDPVSGDVQSGIAATEYDPISGLFVSLGPHGLYTYDPATRDATWVGDALDDSSGNPADLGSLGYAEHLTYFPPNDTFYYFIRGAPVGVFALALDRADFTQSTLDIVAANGPSSDHSEPGYAFDGVNHIIGGGVLDNVFYAFDPLTATWSAHTMQGGQPGSVAFHALAYDPVNNVFVFVSEDFDTWAYRFRNP